jgi:hypothetical protein
MRLRPTLCIRRAAKRAGAGFTLAELLAAMLLMVLVIPAAVQGLRTANMAGQVGERKAVAARIGENVLNEAIISGQLQTAVQTGTVQEGPLDYQWSIEVEPWNLGEMNLMTVQVTFPVQGQEYDVRLSTLVDVSQ